MANDETDITMALPWSMASSSSDRRHGHMDDGDDDVDDDDMCALECVRGETQATFFTVIVHDALVTGNSEHWCSSWITQRLCLSNVT